MKQSGVFRTNCIDCLDRTNVVQSLIARKSLEHQLRQLGVFKSDATIAGESVSRKNIVTLRLFRFELKTFLNKKWLIERKAVKLRLKAKRKQFSGRKVTNWLILRSSFSFHFVNIES